MKHDREFWARHVKGRRASGAPLVTGACGCEGAAKRWGQTLPSAPCLAMNRLAAGVLFSIRFVGIGISVIGRRYHRQIDQSLQ